MVVNSTSWSCVFATTCMYSDVDHGFSIDYNNLLFHHCFNNESAKMCFHRLVRLLFDKS